MLLIAIPQLPQQPKLRSNIVLVPVDVRVVDERGNPVTDLSSSDFEVLEDGVVQEIAHWAMYEPAILASGTGAGSPTLLTMGKETEEDGKTGRVFLIVLGRGDLEGPSHGLTALADFVKNRLQPSDCVAVLAYKRVTDFTSDGDQILRLLERYRDAHRSIEQRLQQWFIAEDIHAKITALFTASGLPATRELPHPFNPSNVGQFVLGVNHLRLLKGEKHLIFLTENTLGGPLMTTLARTAADARIAVSIIRTGGSISRMAQPAFGSRSGSVRFTSRSFNELWHEQDARDLARQTGGQTYLYQYADKALDAIDRASRVRYLLGYYPTHSTRDGTYRNVVVKVKRAGLKVLYRHGYYARSESVPIDPRSLIAHERLRAAGRMLRAPHDIAIVGRTTARRSGDGQLRVHLALEVQMTNVSFRSDGYDRVAELELATFVGDSKQNVIGELHQQAVIRRDVQMPSSDRNRPFTYSAEIAVHSTPRHVKIVVYDALGDRLGVAVFDVVKE